MSRLLLLVLIVLAVWWLARPARPLRRGDTERRRPAALPERMVRCSHCGVYLPQSEAIGAGERYFCSEEHRRLAR